MELQLDYNPFSILNILNENKNMPYEMAYAIHLSAKRQMLRISIKKELCDYFLRKYINGERQLK